jgi:putative membrane protein
MRACASFVSTVALAIMLAGPASAQQARTATPPTGQQNLSQQDAMFIKEAALGGMAEVELGRLADQNAQANEVKQFGARMVQDHSAANNELTALASNKGVTPGQRLDPKHAQLRDKLSKLRGAEFDRAYMQGMVKDHDKTVKLFRQQAQRGADPDLKRFAETTLSTIEEHDKLAHEIVKSLAPTGGAPRNR